MKIERDGKTGWEGRHIKGRHGVHNESALAPSQCFQLPGQTGINNCMTRSVDIFRQRRTQGWRECFDEEGKRKDNFVLRKLWVG